MAAAAPADTATATKILEYLRKPPSPKKACEVAKHLSITRKEANNQLYSMEKKKMVKRQGSNWEAISNSGDSQERPAPADTTPVVSKELCKTPCSSLTAVSGVTESAQRILSFLEENGRGQTALDIAKGIGKGTAKEVNPMLYALKEKGLLTHNPTTKLWTIKGKEEITTTGDCMVGTQASVGSLSGKQLQNEQNQVWPSGYQTQTRGEPSVLQSCIRSKVPCMQSKVQNVHSREQLGSQEKSLKQTQSEAATLGQQIQKQVGSVRQQSPYPKCRVNEEANMERQVKEGQEEQPSNQTMPVGQEAETQEAQSLNIVNNHVEETEQLANNKAEISGNQPQKAVEHQATSLVLQAHNEAMSSEQQALINNSQSGKLAFNLTTGLGHHSQLLVAPICKRPESLAFGKTKDSISTGEKEKITKKIEFSEPGMELPFFQNVVNAITDCEHIKPIILAPLQSESTENTIQHSHEQNVVLYDIRDHLITQSVAMESLRQAKVANAAMLRRKLTISKQQVKATKVLADAVTSCALQIQTLNNWLQGSAMPAAEQACTSNKVQDALAQIAVLLGQQNSLVQSVQASASGSVTLPLSSPPQLPTTSPEQEIREPVLPFLQFHEAISVGVPADLPPVRPLGTPRVGSGRNHPSHHGSPTLSPNTVNVNYIIQNNPINYINQQGECNTINIAESRNTQVGSNNIIQNLTERGQLPAALTYPGPAPEAASTSPEPLWSHMPRQDVNIIGSRLRNSMIGNNNTMLVLYEQAGAEETEKSMPDEETGARRKPGFDSESLSHNVGPSSENEECARMTTRTSTPRPEQNINIRDSHITNSVIGHDITADNMEDTVSMLVSRTQRLRLENDFKLEQTSPLQCTQISINCSSAQCINIGNSNYMNIENLEESLETTEPKEESGEEGDEPSNQPSTI